MDSFIAHIRLFMERSPSPRRRTRRSAVDHIAFCLALCHGHARLF